MKKYLILFLVFLFVTVCIYAQSYRCQLDNNNMIWTGKTKTEMGKIAKLYRCPSGHEYWIVDQNNNNNNNQQPNNRNPRCQYDSNSLMWTGKTKTEYGKILKEYKCVTGHIYWLTN